LYILLLFPLNYLVVHKWLRRPLAAWITFPLVLIVFGAGAVVLARARDEQGSPAVNQVELVDVDVSTRAVRGTHWATLYSPQAGRYDVEFAPRFLGAAPANGKSRLSWHGLAGSGIGGMSAGGNEFGVDSIGYRQAAADRLTGVPVLTAATKSFEARWAFELSSAPLAATLWDNEGLLGGQIVNSTGAALHSARLLYGTWAYRLRDIEPSATISIDEKLTPISVQTLITGLALGSPTGGGVEHASLVAARASIAELMNAMMFYEAAGGVRFARIPLRYEAYCDLSRQLALGRAVLVAEVSSPGSRLLNAESAQPVGTIDDQSAHVVYRFVLPVKKSE
jgi:hypothetical protein